MRGHLRIVVDRAFVELWQPLTDHDDCPVNVFAEVYAGLRPFLREPEPEYVKEDDGTIRDNSVGLDHLMALAMSEMATAERLLAGLSGADFESESAVRRAFSSTYSVLSDVATGDLANNYLHLLKTFVERYSLRYYVDERAQLWISFLGVAEALFGQLRLAAEGNPHLLQELNAFEHTLAECLAEPVETRIKTTIQKQVNVLEAFGSGHPLVSGNTLGRMLKEVGSWPHDSLNDAASLLYKFACDYPGIRHAGTYDSATRALDLRDLAGVTLSLVGLVAYLDDDFKEQLGPAMQGDLASLGTDNGATAPWVAVLAEDASKL